jgi:hypothetical protein
MRLEFIAAGSHDTPLIRLYGTDVEPLLELSREVERLSRRVPETVEVHRIAGITAIDNCRLTLESVHKRPRSLVVKKADRLDFVGRATCEAWITVHWLIAPFLRPEPPSGRYQWLLGGDARGVLSPSSIALLVSTYPDGRW